MSSPASESVRLLYYNPNIAVGASAHHLPGMARFSQFFKMFNPTVVFVDRTETIRIPVKVQSLSPMPKIRPLKKTYEEVCNERAIELLRRADSLGVPLYVFWSGGIDSTLILVSLLKNATAAQRDNITVLMTEESISENPNFYHQHIRGKLHIDSSTMFPYILGTNNLVVGGEHNDQVFGSDMVGKLITRFGNGTIHAPYSRDLFFTFFNEKLADERVTNFYLDLFERLKSAAPVPVTSNFDLLWWINFSLKWQSVFLRMLSFTTPRNAPAITAEYVDTRYAHFYGTDDFQLWSMNNMDKKIKDEWRTYKWPAKEIIYEYTKDADYRDNKTKKGSLHFLLLQRSPYLYIDQKFRLLHELAPEAYYEPKNDFV